MVFVLLLSGIRSFMDNEYNGSNELIVNTIIKLNNQKIL